MARAKNKERADGRLQSKIYLGNVDGKPRYKYVYARTQKELDAKILDVKMSIHKGLNLLPGNDTFGFWADYWLKLKSQEVSMGRYDSYKSLSKKFECLRTAKIKSITTFDIQSIITENSHLAYSTLVHLKNSFVQVFSVAIENRILDYNPAEFVKIPKNTKPKLERRALNATERQWIIDTPDYMQLPAMIMMFAGLRRGELVALTWADVDLEKKTITVNKSAEVIRGTFHTKDSTKTPSGMRTVYIPNILVDYLRPYYKATSDLVCPSPCGKMLATKTWNRKWHDYLQVLDKKYGTPIDSKFSDELSIPMFTAHWLRHTFVTLLYMAGVDVLTAKEQAGHTDIRTTMAIYTHLDKTYKVKSMNRLDDYLDGCQADVKV
jgi:integrase